MTPERCKTSSHLEITTIVFIKATACDTLVESAVGVLVSSFNHITWNDTGALINVH